MASVTLTMEGLAEFKAELLRLPIELRAEAGNVVLSQARAAASAIAAGYPQKSGNLRSGVRTIKEAADQYSAIATVVSASPHVLLYERGTKPRAVRKPIVVKFKDGSYRRLKPNRGSMPGREVFVPRIQPFREGMYLKLAAIMRQAGLDVQTFG